MCNEDFFFFPKYQKSDGRFFLQLESDVKQSEKAQHLAKVSSEASCVHCSV